MIYVYLFTVSYGRIEYRMFVLDIAIGIFEHFPINMEVIIEYILDDLNEYDTLTWKYRSAVATDIFKIAGQLGSIEGTLSCLLPVGVEDIADSSVQ